MYLDCNHNMFINLFIFFGFGNNIQDKKGADFVDEIKSPLTGELIGSLEYTKDEELPFIMEKSKESFKLWSSLSLGQRIEFMTRLRKYLVEMGDEISREISKITGKPVIEAYSAEIMATVETIKYYEKNTEKILGIQKKSTPIYFATKKSYVEYRPMGPILIISPWNFPFHLSMAPMVSALIAGNSVILKPSPETIYIGKIVERIFKSLDFPKDVLQVVYGDNGSGFASKLIEMKPSKVFFTGSTETGKKILKQASEHMIPVDLELGGKDPMIVFKDANLERAASAAIWGAFTNSGQVCLSVERLYVQEEIYDEFISLLKGKIGEIWQGNEPYADMGCMTSLKQIDKVKEHIEDAKQNGAKAHSKGAMVDGNRFMPPTILTDVNHTMKVMREETFGPVLPVMKFNEEEEAIFLANDSEYGLGAYVFTSDSNKASRVASKLEAGMIGINEVIIPVANIDLPFGGVKASGIGRYHGEEGLRTFTNPVSIVYDSGFKSKEINWFPYSKNKMKLMEKMLKFLYR